MKTIGVLGGLGPQATMDFEARVHRVAQELIAPNVNSGFPPMVVYYYRFVPFVATETGEPERLLRPDLDSSRRRLRSVAWPTPRRDLDFLHLFQAEIEQVTGCELLSMIAPRWRRFNGGVGAVEESPGSAIRSCTRAAQRCRCHDRVARDHDPSQAR